LEDRLLTDRVQKLREQSLEAIPHIWIGRGEIVTDTYLKNEGKVSTPVLRALTFKDILEQKPICINDGELIVGEKGDSPAGAPTFPELCCHTKKDFDVMNHREKISFKVDKNAYKIHKNKIKPYWEKRSIRHKILETMSEEWMDAYEAGVFTEFMEQRAPGHTVADKKVFTKGFNHFKSEIRNSKEKFQAGSDPDKLDRIEQLKAMEITCDAIIRFAERHSEKALELASTEKDPQRKKELENIAEVCKYVPANAPRNFHEALQAYWFIHLGVTTELNTWDAFNPGRLDQHLQPFFEKGIKDGSLTKDSAYELLNLFWIKFNNQPAPPKVGFTLLESATYTDFANINSGGLTTDGSDAVNEMSYMVLDCIEEMRLLQPSSNIQLSEKNPDKFIERALHILKKGGGQPSIFNSDAVIQEMLNMGKSIEDARDGGTSGCVETGAFGKEAYILHGYFNLTKILDLTLHNGYDNFSEKQLSVGTGDAMFFGSFEELMSAFKEQLKYFIDIKIEGSNKIAEIYAETMPAPFLSVIIDDCISTGKDYNAGGARYNSSYIQGVGTGTITDSLSSIKQHVFDNERFTMQSMIQAIDDNFDGYEVLHSIVKNKTKKYGNDDDYPDSLMQEVFNAFYDSVNGRPNAIGGHYRINMLPTTSHVYFGSVIGATADGRKAGKPLSEGISPVQGADKKGPTAVLKSASKMDHLKTGGTLLNQKFTPQIFNDPKGVTAIKDLVRTYFKMNGHHLQFNVVNADTLRDAQLHPQSYGDLIVRVAGYSDYFNNLGSDLQDEIIERTEQCISI
jgi:pyruvate formate-lyase/glycerol dehydratase family glycyl radical enzyme